MVKFCVRVGPRSISLVMTNYLLSGRGQGHATRVNFLADVGYLQSGARQRYTYNGRLIGNHT